MFIHPLAVMQFHFYVDHRWIIAPELLNRYNRKCARAFIVHVRNNNDEWNLGIGTVVRGSVRWPSQLVINICSGHLKKSRNGSVGGEDEEIVSGSGGYSSLFSSRCCSPSVQWRFVFRAVPITPLPHIQRRFICPT